MPDRGDVVALSSLNFFLNDVELGLLCINHFDQILALRAEAVHFDLFGTTILLGGEEFVGYNLLPKGAKLTLIIFEFLVHFFVLAETLKLGRDFLQDDGAYLVELGLLLLDDLERGEFAVLIQARAGGLFD